MWSSSIIHGACAGRDEESIYTALTLCPPSIISMVSRVKSTSAGSRVALRRVLALPASRLTNPTNLL